MGLTRISATSVTDTDFKTSCKVATSTNISSFTAAPNSIDGYTFSVGDRVLVKSQNNSAENGIYVVESVGTGSNGRWSRAGDFRDNKGITNGAITFIERGTEANTFFFLGGLTSSVTVGSTALTFNSLVTETAATVIGSSQPNITSVGTLTSLAVTGNANVGNILAGGFYFSNGSPFTVDSTQILNGNSNVKVAANGNISISVTGNSNIVVVTDTGANVNGYANITGDGTIGGNLTVTGNFTVNGTTTTLNTTTLDVEDLNITLAKGAASSSAANGAGITVDGANATFVYNNTSNTWVSSHGANITGAANITGNANIGNLGTAQVLASANITAPQLISNIATGTAPLVVTSTTRVSNLNVANAGYADTAGSATSATSATTAGTVTTAAQPNITSVGTLSSLNVTGNANVGNLNTTGDIKIGGNDIRSSTGNIAITLNDKDVTVVGNLAVQGVTTTIGSENYTVQDSIINLHTFPNLAPLTADDGRDIGIKMHYFKSTTDKHAFLGWENSTGFLEYISDATESSGVISGTYGTIKVANVFANSGVIYNGNSNVTITANANVSVFVAGNATARAVFTSTGANIAGTLDVTGNVTVSNITANGTANLGAIANVKITGGSSNQFIKTDGAGNLSFGAAGGINFTASATAPSSPALGDQWYDTSTDILYSRISDGTSNIWIDITSQANSFASISVNANANVGNINLTGNIIDTGALDISTGSNGNISLSPNGTGIVVSSKNISAPAIVNGNSNVALAANSNVTVSVAGTANVLVVTSTGANIAGTLNATGNANVGNLGTGTVIATTANLTTINSGLIQNGNSNVTITANANVSIFVAGNATARAVFTSTGANIAGTANITGATSLGNNLTFSGTGLRLSGDFSNATLTNRLMFQSSTTNGTTSIGVLPNGTSTSTNINLFGGADPTNTSIAQMVNTGSEASFRGAISGTGTYLPLTFYTSGSERARIDIGGNALIGTNAIISTSTSKLQVAGSGTTAALTLAKTDTPTSTASIAGIDGWANDGSTYVVGGTINFRAAENWTSTNHGTDIQFRVTASGAAGALAEAMRITSAGNVGIGNTAPTHKLTVAGNIVPSANATSSLGNTSLRWANIWGLASSAQYADLAEKYLADENYSPGTVVIFGGSSEITITTQSHDSRVAGVISTEPAYLMNDNATQGNLWLPVALTGRVPCRVQGPVKKGDVLVASNTAGVAEKIDKTLYEPGCVIGKSLENHAENTIKTIEVVVGRF
jgi:hypothetical protein